MINQLRALDAGLSLEKKIAYGLIGIIELVSWTLYN